MTTVSFSEKIEICMFSSNNELPEPELLEPELTETDKSKEKPEKKYSSHTKFCNFGFNKCRKGEKCVYAHTFKQLNPILCKWNEECVRKEKCYFKHSNETKVNYVKRAFPEDLKRLNIVLYDQLETNKSTKIYKDDTEKNSNPNLSTNNNMNDQLFDDDYKNALRDFISMYYDPAFECFSWADINEFVDSDDDD